MLFFEAFIKFGAIGLMLGIGLLVYRDGRSIRALRFSLPLIVAMCFMLMTTGSPAIAITGPIKIPMRLFDCLNTVFIWWLGLALFDDDFKLGLREWIISGIYALAAITLRTYNWGFHNILGGKIVVVVSGLSLALMLHLCYKAITGHKEDLVEQRRRIRIWFIVAVAMVVVASNLAERTADWFGMYQDQTIWVTYIFTFMLALWALLWLTRLHPEVIIFDSNQPIAPEPSRIEERDKPAYEKLVSVMETDRAYTKHGFAIGDLAELIGIPSHQLRKLINQSMGYRNFASFLNKYRIAHVKQSLSDPEKARVPVLTLAMEAGFSSLAPFNRAFKASEGVTPSDFRAEFLDKTNSNTVQN